MNIRGLIMVAALAVVPIACAANGAKNLSPVAPSMALRTASRPQILQNAAQWVDFTPGFSNTNLFSVVVGSDKQIWVNQFGPDLAHYSMAGVLKKYTLNVTGPNGPGTQMYPQTMVLAGKNIYANGQDVGWGGSAVFALITPQHKVNVFSIPSGDAASGNGIAYDPVNGTVWLGETSHVGEVTVATNAIVEYATNNDIAAVAYGPDGNIWAYGTSPSQLYVFNPTDGSVLATYPVCGALFSLVNGGDGNLYGAGAGCGNYLAKISTAGAIAHIALPTGAAPYPVDIALVGAGFEKGHVFVDERNGHNLLDYNPTSGVVTEIAAPSQYSGDSAYGTAAGPDGNVWTADINGNVLVYVINLITANPSSITVGVGNTVLLTASEPDGYRLKATSSNTGIATVTKVAGGYDVKGVSAGTCSITLKDNIFNSLKVPVTVQ